MITRLLIFKGTFVALACLCFAGLLISDTVQAVNSGGVNSREYGQGPASSIPGYSLPILAGCLAVAACVAFGDLILARDRGALPTYGDEEFVARFGGRAPDEKSPHG